MGPTVTRPVQDPLAVLNLDNRPDHIFKFFEGKTFQKLWLSFDKRASVGHEVNKKNKHSKYEARKKFLILAAIIK